MGLSVALAGAIAGTQALNLQLQPLAGDQATLAALGMTRRERIAATVLFAVPVAAAVAAAAVAVAVAASPLFPISLARRAEPDPGLHADWVVLGAGAAVVVAAILAAAAVRGWRFTRDLRFGAGSAVEARPGIAAGGSRRACASARAARPASAWRWRAGPVPPRCRFVRRSSAASLGSRA